LPDYHAAKYVGTRRQKGREELGDGVSMTYGSDGHTHIVTARATSEERKIYAERNKAVGREKVGAQAQHSGYSADMETLFA